MAVVVQHMNLRGNLNDPDTDRTAELKQKLSKRLAYLLRYGAEREGIRVHPGGYVDVQQLVKIPLMKHNTQEEVLEQVQSCISSRGTPRFEKKTENGSIYVRATYGRHMHRHPCHEGTNVTRLIESCMNLISQNIEQFDFEGFPDQFLINTLLHKMKREKRLSNRVLKLMLCPTFEHLDLEGIFLTEGSIKIVSQRCPHLKVLNLRGCGYLLTDHLMQILLKKLPELESFNLSNCHHLTDQSLSALSKNCKNLQHLDVSGIPQLSQEGILNFIGSCETLKQLDIYDNRNIKKAGKEKLVEFGRERGLVVVLKGLDNEEVAPKDPSILFPFCRSTTA